MTFKNRTCILKASPDDLLKAENLILQQGEVMQYLHTYLISKEDSTSDHLLSVGLDYLKDKEKVITEASLEFAIGEYLRDRGDIPVDSGKLLNKYKYRYIFNPNSGFVDYDGFVSIDYGASSIEGKISSFDWTPGMILWSSLHPRYFEDFSILIIMSRVEAEN